jgi:hypothetical protein
MYASNFCLPTWHNMKNMHSRVARWYICKPKIPIWVNFRGSCWYILWPSGIFSVIWYIFRPFGIFYGHLVYFTDIRYIVCPFGVIWHAYLLDIWYNFWLFGIFIGYLAYFLVIWYIFWYVVAREIWQPRCTALFSTPMWMCESFFCAKLTWFWTMVSPDNNCFCKKMHSAEKLSWGRFCESLSSVIYLWTKLSLGLVKVDKFIFQKLSWGRFCE